MSLVSIDKYINEMVNVFELCNYFLSMRKPQTSQIFIYIIYLSCKEGTHRTSYVFLPKRMTKKNSFPEK